MCTTLLQLYWIRYGLLLLSSSLNQALKNDITALYAFFQTLVWPKFHLYYIYCHWKKEENKWGKKSSLLFLISTVFSVYCHFVFFCRLFFLDFTVLLYTFLSPFLFVLQLQWPRANGILLWFLLHSCAAGEGNTGRVLQLDSLLLVWYIILFVRKCSVLVCMHHCSSLHKLWKSDLICCCARFDRPL